MLIVPVSGPGTQLIKVICGEDSDNAEVMFGPMPADITDVVREAGSDDLILLQVTRCRDEVATLRGLIRAGIKVAASPLLAVLRPGEMPAPASSDAAAPRSEPSQPKSEHKSAAKAGTTAICSYCHTQAVLLPIPNFKICPTCAQIELGRRRRRPDAPAKESHG